MRFCEVGLVALAAGLMALYPLFFGKHLFHVEYLLQLSYLLYLFSIIRHIKPKEWIISEHTPVRPRRFP